MIGNIRINTKMLNFEVRVLIGWFSHSIRYPANQNAFLKIKCFCFYVKVAYHFRPEYNCYWIIRRAFKPDCVGTVYYIYIDSYVLVPAQIELDKNAR